MTKKVHPVLIKESSKQKSSAAHPISSKEVSIRCIVSAIDTVVCNVANTSDLNDITMLDICNDMTESLQCLRLYAQNLQSVSHDVGAAVRAGGSVSEATLLARALASVSAASRYFIPRLSSCDARRLGDGSWDVVSLLKASAKAVSVNRRDCHAGSRSVRQVLGNIIDILPGETCSLKELAGAHVMVKKLHEILTATKKNEEMSKGEVMELSKCLQECSEFLEACIVSMDDKLTELRRRLIRCRLSFLDAVTNSC